MRQVNLRHGFFPVLAVFVLVMGYSPPGDAAVYKWKDDQGITHFTDDPGKIPPAYRDSAAVKKMPRTAPSQPAPESPSVTDEKQSAAEGGEKSAPMETPADMGEEGARLKQAVEAAQKAIQFLESEVPRYDAYFDRFPGRGAYRDLRGLMQQVVKEKKTLAEALVGIETPACQAALQYLDTSLPKDEKFATSRGGYMKKFKTEILRLKAEKPGNAQLLQKLKTELVDLKFKIEQQAAAPAADSVETVQSSRGSHAVLP